MKKKWKWIIPITCAVVLAVLCVPKRYVIKDGGSIMYESVLYRVTYYHGMLGQETDENGDLWFYTAQERVKAKPGEWWEFGGTEVQILGCTVYSNTGLKKVPDAEDAQSEQTPAPEGYRLIVNGEEVPVDSVYQESAKGEVYGMLPITAVFRGIGCETEVKGDTVEIKKDGSLWLVLDLNAHTLVNPDDPAYNYFLIAPGDTGSDFKRQRSDDELWVCKRYVGNAFQLLGMPMRVVNDETTREMRITIGDTDG